jgi:hypothetical protein
MGVAERRARLGRRHRLAAGAAAADPLEVASSLVALHGSDPSTVYLSSLARMDGGDVAAVERALYQDRSLVRRLCMRRTVFVIPTELAPAVLAASARTVATQQRRLLLGVLAQNGVTTGDVETWLTEVERVALDALTSLGEATANEIGAADPRLRAELVLARGKKYEGRMRVVSRVLLVLAAQGLIVRGRPLGGWTSSQFRWSVTDRWQPGGIPEMSTVDAEEELARRWLAAFGPATVDDLRWWTGWTATQTKRALGRIDPVEVDLDGTHGIVLPDDLDPVPPVDEPWVALLPGLDPTAMGWNRREFYLGEHAERLFDNTGNVSPTVWLDGRIVGGWAQRKDGEVVVRLLEDIGSDAVTAIKQSAAALTERLGDVRLTARARRPSPVERELLA